MSKILFVVGEPGVGKSTLVDHAFGSLERAEVDHREAGGPMRELLWHDAVLVGCELGRRAGKHPEGYPGTDTMSQTAIVGVDDWLRAGADDLGFVVLEGTRLMNKRFVTAVLGGGHSLDLFYLYGPEIARQRREERGSQQNAQWLKGRQTAARNFYQLVDRLRNTEDHVHTHVLAPHRPVEDNSAYILAMAGLPVAISR
jgi:energy-coupling factor transporter ATP-binding protein EcfA2